MRKMTFGKMVLGGVLLVLAGLAGPRTAQAEFSVPWGRSLDSGLMGYEHVAQWLVSEGYYGSLSEAEVFAKEGYLGYDETTADPFFWTLSQSFQVQVVQEIAGYSDKNTLGYYFDGNGEKTLTQIFGGTENGPKTLMLDQPFGFYLSTPEQQTWYTDRTANSQVGTPFNNGGDAQALVYELNPGSEWLVAWEDLDVTRRVFSDKDYNDMYLKVSVVPEPVSSVLFLLGSGVMTGVAMRKKISPRSRG